MFSPEIKKKIRAHVTNERIIVGVGTVIVYSYMMNKAGYRMVKPAYNTDTHAVFNRPFGGTTAVRIAQ